MWFSNPRFGREIFDYSIPNRKIFRILRRGSPNSLPARFPIFANFWEFWEILEKPKKRDGPQKRDSDQKQENHQNVMMNDPGRNFWNSRNSNREFLDNDLAVSRGISQRAAKFLDTQYKAKMDHLRELHPYHYPRPKIFWELARTETIWEIKDQARTKRSLICWTWPDQDEDSMRTNVQDRQRDPRTQR